MCSVRKWALHCLSSFATFVFTILGHSFRHTVVIDSRFFEQYFSHGTRCNNKKQLTCLSVCCHTKIASFFAWYKYNKRNTALNRCMCHVLLMFFLTITLAFNSSVAFAQTNNQDNTKHQQTKMRWDRYIEREQRINSTWVTLDSIVKNSHYLVKSIEPKRGGHRIRRIRCEQHQPQEQWK